MKKTILVFALLILALLVLFQIGKYTLVSGNMNTEIMIAVIADKLFLSESTIKTYVSNLLVKLNAKRRTQAIQKAKILQII